MSTNTRPYQDLPTSQVVHTRPITRRYASTLHSLVRAFTFVGTVLLTSGVAVVILSPPLRVPRRHDSAKMMGAGSTDDDSTGTTGGFTGVPIGIALLCLGVFAYITALVLYYKDRYSHGEMVMRYRGVYRGDDESPSAGRITAVKAHVPAVTALHVYRPQIEYKLVLVQIASTM